MVAAPASAERRQRRAENRKQNFPFEGRVKRIRKAVDEIVEDETQPRSDRIFQIRMLARDLVELEHRMCAESDFKDLMDLARMR